MPEEITNKEAIATESQTEAQIESQTEEMYQQMQEYLKMTELLPLEEFNAYYRKAMDFLQLNYQALSQDQQLKMKAICAIVSQNSAGRAHLDKMNRKKFQKIEEKSKFWTNAIELRLKKEGLSQEDIETREKLLFKDSQE